MLMSSVSSPYLLFPEKTKSRSCLTKNDLINIKPGHCPKCQMEFKSPVSLPCGHSVCQQCCDEMLMKCNNKASTMRRNPRTVMGVSMMKQKKNTRSGKIQKTLSIISESESNFRPVYLSPACLVCRAVPKYQAPIPNFALEKLLEAWEKYKTVSQRRTSTKRQDSRNLFSPTPSSTSSSGFEENDENSRESNSPVDFGIRKCNIAVFGATGVGKSRLVRAQHLNKLFFGQISESSSSNDPIDPVEELQAKYMIEILDNNDIDGDLEDADAIILAYACNDHTSFVSAFKLYEEINKRGYSKLPLVLVSTKCDIDLHRREIKQEEAESLARHIGCPHMEISAKKNIGVNEVFTQIIKLIETKTDNTLTLD